MTDTAAPDTAKPKRTVRASRLANYLAGLDYASTDGGLDLYHRVVRVDPQLKGQISTALGSDGYAVMAGVKVNFADIFLPSLSDFLQLEAGVEFTGTREKADMLAVYRMPAQAWDVRIDHVLHNPVSPSGTRGNIEAVSKPAATGSPSRANHSPVPRVFESQRPTAFLLLAGDRYQGTAKATLAAGVKASFQPVDEFELAGAARAELSGDVTYRINTFLDPSPNHYPANEFSEALKRDFDAALALTLKQQAVELLQDLRALDVSAGKKLRQGMKGLLKEFKNVLSHAKLKVTLSPSAIYAAMRGRKSHNALITELEKMQLRVQSLKNVDEIKRREAVGRCIVLIGKMRLARPDRPIKKSGALARLADRMRLRISELGKKTTYDPGPYSFLRSTSAIYAGKIGATISSSSKGLGTAGGKKVGAGLGMTGEASLDGSFQRTSYRLQVASAPGPKQIVMTQDTLQTKKQALGKIAANFGLASTQTEYDSSTMYGAKQAVKAAGVKDSPINDAELLKYNAMAYTSFTAYWLYGSTEEAELLPNGSGISYGYSTDAQKFLDWLGARRGNKKLNKEQEKFEGRFKKALRLSNTAITEFAAKCPVDEDYLMTGTPDAINSVLLESSYAFTKPMKFKLRKSRTPRDSDDKKIAFEPEKFFDDKEKWMKHFPDPEKELPPDAAMRLDQVRVRVLLGGTEARSDRVFHLGFTHIVGISAAFDKLSSAGVESALDLFVWNASEEGETPIAQGRIAGVKSREHWTPDVHAELSVPPVAMVHQ